MPNSLEQKIRAVEDEHYEHAEQQHIALHGQGRRDQAMRFLGGALSIDRLKEHLASQVIAALITIEDQKLYLEYDHDRFADFLDDCEFSNMSKSQFYRLKELFLKEGPEKYDLFTEWRIPLSTRKLLTSADVQIEIDGDEVIIGGEERVNVAESRTIKAIIEKLVKEKTTLTEDLSKQETKAEKQADQIKQGRSEYEELQRNFDALKEDGPFATALMRFLGAAQTLIAEINDLPADERDKRAKDDVAIFTEQWFRIRDAYGLKVPLTDQRPATVSKPVEEMTEDEKKATFIDRNRAALDAEGYDDLD